MPKKVKVNVIEILLKNNKIAKYGDIVDATKLTQKIDDLIQSGFVTPYNGEVELAHGDSEDKGLTNEDNDLTAEDYSDLTKAELNDLLDARGIEHDEKARNDELRQLLIDDDYAEQV